ncbi:minor tail protein [Mycobacterium phage Kumao]|uniref:D-Ala-D-Ala carboxypeptidase n=1 Tax=Mycobacterium phage Kumao TaxID=2041344 RepID=A0A2D1GPS1_9CAUD|nr:minor tail protein [Mycobacterium phage Kumao]ATN93994.1 D-Ala-D-Ala carboxypeptidase [Mycobacterium phage Kumao]
MASVIGYNVYKNGEKLNNAPVQRLSGVTEYVISELSAGTAYDIGVSAVNSAGQEGPITLLSEVMTQAYIPVGDEMSPLDEAKVDAVIEKCMNDYGMGPGMMVYTTGPRGTLMKAYGWSNSSKTEPMTTDMHFRIGSHTKTFTGHAVLMAVDKGLISLEDTIDQFDSERWTLSNLPNADKITIRHLMMMRAGLFNEQEDLGVLIMFYLNNQYPWSDDSTLNVLRSHTPHFDPGTGFKYVNGNYAVLGAILEAVDGRPARQIIKEDIWDELGMTETSWGTTSMPKPFCRGYGGMGSLTADKTNFNPALSGLAGEVVSTMEDLHKWAVAQRDNHFLSEELWELQNSIGCWMPSGVPSDAAGGKPGYLAYGLSNYIFGSWRSHPGSWVGYECCPMWNIDNGAIIIVVENSQSPAGGVGAAPMLRTLPMLAAELYPDTLEDPPEEQRNTCSIASHPFIYIDAPGNKNYGGISSPIYGLGSAQGSFTAPLDADVFAVVNWDRNGSNIPTVEYGGETMEYVGHVLNDNNSSYGGVAVFRANNVGTGAGKQLKATGSGWLSVLGLSFSHVDSVDTPETLTGYSVTAEMPIENEDGITLIAVGAGNGGGPTYAWGPMTLGARTRQRMSGTYPPLLVATTHMSLNAITTASSKNHWSAMAVHINFTN